MEPEKTITSVCSRLFGCFLSTFLIFFQVLTLQAVVWTEQFAADARKEYLSAKTNYLQHSTSVEAAWKFGRAAFDQGEFAQNDAAREQVALEGIAACRKAIELSPTNAAAHYYLAMNLGQLARTKTLGALKLVKEMEKSFKRSVELDKSFDYAGATRSLGILYLEAPGWPTSIGNKTKAREYLQLALKLAPNYPENHLCLLDAYHRWGEKEALREGITKYKKLLLAAKDEFKGPEWEDSWADWNERYKILLSQSTFLQ